MYLVVFMPRMNDTPNLLCEGEAGHFHPCTDEELCKSGINVKANPDTGIVNWIVTFKLFCKTDKKELFLKVIYYFFFGGFFFGTLFIVPLADYFGRKLTLVLSSLLMCLVYLKSVFSSDVYGCAVVLMFAGILAAVYYGVSIVYLTEVATQESAVVYAVLFNLAFPIAGIVVTVLFKALPDWRPIAGIMSLVPLIVLLYAAYIAESPRFLASKGMYQDAKLAANKICALNLNTKINWTFPEEKNRNSPEYTKFNEEREDSLTQYSLFFRYSSGRQYISGFCILLFCTGFAFAGLALTQKKILDSDFLDSIALYAIDFGMIFFGAFYINSIGHKKSLLLSLLITGGLAIACYIALALSDKFHGLVTYLTKLFALISFAGSISFAAEACPARVRATGLGITLSFGALGLLLGGFVWEFHDKLHLVFGVVACCGLVPLGWLTEPKDLQSNDDFLEILEYKKKNFVETIEEKKEGALGSAALG